MRNTSRVARNTVSQKVVEMERAGATFEEIRDLVAGSRGRLVYEEGDPERGVWSAGMIQGLIHDIPTCQELIHRIVAEAEEIIAERLGSMMHGRRMAAE